MSTEKASQLVYLKHNMDKVPSYDLFHKELKQKVASVAKPLGAPPAEGLDEVPPEEPRAFDEADEYTEQELDDFLAIAAEDDTEAPAEEYLDEDTILGLDT